MLRESIFAILTLIIVGSFSLISPSVEAQSSGCASVNALDPLLYQSGQVSTGSQAFQSGEVITITGSDIFTLDVTGTATFSSTGTSASYTIPQDGNYTVTVTDGNFSDTTITPSCVEGSDDSDGGAGGTPGVYNHFAFRIYNDGGGVYSVWGDCISANECQVIAIVNLNNESVTSQGYAGGWSVSIFAIDTTGEQITYQFNIYANGNLIDDNFTATIIPSSGGSNTVVVTDPDGDGFTGGADRCPNLAGSVDGCPDTDGDGIVDSDDACPVVAGVADWDGCTPPPPPITIELSPIEVFTSNPQCYGVSIVGEAETHEIPSADVPANQLPHVIGGYELHSDANTIVTSGSVLMEIDYEGDMVFSADVRVPAGVPIATQLEFTLSQNFDYEITGSHITLFDANCNPYTDSVFFTYVFTTGNYTSLSVGTEDDDNTCEHININGVPIFEATC